MSGSKDFSSGSSHLPLSFSPSLLLAFFLILIPVLVLTILSRAAGEKLPDLSPYPWIYLRDGEAPGPDENVAEVIAVGDVMVGRRAGPKPFDHARPWLRAADVVVGNLESVIVGDPEACLSGSACEGPQFLLQAPPSAVAQLRDAGFNVLGLANNHALDLGPEGLEETASRLQTAHIAVIGAGRDGESALHPLVREVRGLRLAFLAFNALSTPQTNTQSGGWTMATWNQDRVAAAVAAVKDRVDAVVVSVHWGYEYETRVDPAQRDAAQALLEAGADLVIGHHPHVAQTFEIDERRVVAFSLGNFVFDQQQGETRRGLALRAFFDDDGLRAVQAIPVWAGPHPRLMTPEDASSLLARVGPPPRRLRFACDDETCRPLEASRRTTRQAGSGVFWGGSIDLTGDGLPEHVRRMSEQVIVHQDGIEAWRSPRTWRVADLALGDPNDDGRSELLLALWKPGLDGLESADQGKERMPRSRPFIVGYRNGVYRTLWGGSAVTHPVHEVELGDIDGDGAQELIVLEGDDRSERTVSVWRWHGWGFSLMWRSHPGQYRDLTLDEDRSISVAFQ